MCDQILRGLKKPLPFNTHLDGREIAECLRAVTRFKTLHYCREVYTMTRVEISELKAYYPSNFLKED